MNNIIIGIKEKLYVQVARKLEQRISRLNHPQELPSYRALAEEFDVSLNVVQRAIKELKKQNLVIAHHGKRIKTIPAKSERIAVKYGFIHPYGNDMSFCRSMYLLVNNAFANLEGYNFLIINSSENNSKQECEIAKNLVYNGVNGLLVWGTTKGSADAFFQKLSKKIPVVFINRLVENIPCVLFDYQKAGDEIYRYLTDKCKREKLLVILDEHYNQAFNDCSTGIIKAATATKHRPDVKFIKFPIIAMLKKIYSSDFSMINTIAKNLERLLKQEQFDSLFCPFDEFTDFVIAGTSLRKQFPDLKIATIRDNLPNQRSCDYNKLNVIEWEVDHSLLFNGGAKLLQKWESSGQAPKTTIIKKINRRRK